LADVTQTHVKSNSYIARWCCPAPVNKANGYDMTMWLLSALIAPVKPVAGKKNWFELDGIPKYLGYGDIGEWLGDEIQDVPDGSKIVADAKLLGIHDNNNLLQDDPRFNHRANIAGDDPEFGNEPEFVVVKKSSSLYLCAMLINAPESAFFDYILKFVYPHEAEWQGQPDEWKRLDPRLAKEYADEEARAIAQAQEWQARSAAMKAAEEERAAKAAAKQKLPARRASTKPARKKVLSKVSSKNVAGKAAARKRAA
jgi:hypothetical protein